MARSLIRSMPLGLCTVLAASVSFAQSPPSEAAQSAAAAAASPAPAAQVTSSTKPSDAKQSKKVWTNEDVAGLNGPVSVVGSSKNPGKTNSGTTADAQYIANTRKQLSQLQSALDDASKQLADLEAFTNGKSASTSGGYQLNKGYNRVPVDQQITNLQEKKKQLQGKIDALLDEARKKDVQPGDLR
jgi:uncharacterized protein involved in exopolysaccharide biosynthesis